jgi:ferric-chelate reductase
MYDVYWSQFPLSLHQQYVFIKVYVVVVFVFFFDLETFHFLPTAKNVAGKFDLSYWNNRAGAIAASHYPLVVALASKNNIISRKFLYHSLSTPQ